MPNEQQEPRGRAGIDREDDSVGREEQRRGISPLDPASMPRAEDDERTYASSPEFHDRVTPHPAPPGEGSTTAEQDPATTETVGDDERT